MLPYVKYTVASYQVTSGWKRNSSLVTLDSQKKLWFIFSFSVNLNAAGQYCYKALAVCHCNRGNRFFHFRSLLLSNCSIVFLFSLCIWADKMLLGFSLLTKTLRASNPELTPPAGYFLSLLTNPGIVFLLLSVHHSKFSPLFSFESSSVQGVFYHFHFLATWSLSSQLDILEE